MLEYIPGFGARLQKFMLGGEELGPQALTNFYAIHTAVLPALLLCLMPFHFWRIRKANGLVIPRAPGEDPGIRGDKVETIPNLIVREVAVALLLLACILFVAMLFNAPLGAKANPGLSPNPTKAPWYFMGLQELLMHFHPLFALCIIPLLLVMALLSIPYVTYQADASGIWFCSAKGRKMAAACAVIAILVTVAGVLVDEFMIGPVRTGTNTVGSGLVPFGVVLAGCAGLYILLKKKFAATNNEAVQSLFVLLVTGFVVLTIIGIWFRGEGMKLVL
jgi:quinol-cytochrome oxidoreductase complex cytochrome b subunit